MHPLLQINLYLSSLFALILCSCSPASGYKFVRSSKITEHDVRSIIPQNKTLLYKTKIDLYNRHFSGILLLKQTDQTTSHLLFVTELGMKMFDFEIKDNVLKLVYVFAPLNKPKIVNLLESDMKLILLQHLLNKDANLYEKKDEKVFRVQENFRYYYLLTPNAKTVKKIIKKGYFFTKVKVNYLYNDSLNAHQINLKHKGLIRLKIKLDYLNKPQD